MCKCDHPDCFTCNGSIYSTANEKLLLSEVVKRLRVRIAVAGVASLSEEEFVVIAEASDLIDRAIGYLEASESPFFNGMKALNEIVGK